QAPGEASHERRSEAHPSDEVRPRSAATDGSQNGAPLETRSDEASKQPAEARHYPETERVFETVAAATEQPAPAERRAEAENEPEAPRRKGWWQR
ncbi:MAG TPA: hypothetical protein VFR71_01935, partial [Methyloceanibacter sp.]|nr:hypothetical protein [Methyloceanibacter sp.]